MQFLISKGKEEAFTSLEEKSDLELQLLLL